MTAATATTPTAAAIATTTAQHETADQFGEHVAALWTELLSVRSLYPSRPDVLPRVIELEREHAAAAARLAELREAEERARPAEQPAGPTFATLAEYREHILNLRRMSEQLATAGATITDLAHALEAQQAALQDIAAAEAAALFERITAGHEDLSDEQRRYFQEQRRSIARLAHGMPLDLEDLPALKRTVEQQDAELARQWPHARAEGRRLAREAIEQNADAALDPMDDSRATVADMVQGLDKARDLAEAHDAFFNSPAGREWLGNEIVRHPDGKSLAEVSIRGYAGRLADALQLEAHHARLQALAPHLSLEPDASAVDLIVGDFVTQWLVPAYTEEERRLERVCHVSPMGAHVLRHFQANPNAYRGIHRVELERRVAEIEAATLSLEAIRATPF